MVAAALGIFVALPDVASAKKFQMTGNWFIRNGQVFIPLGINRPHATKMTVMGNVIWTSMGAGPFPFHFPSAFHLPGSTPLPVTVAIGPWVAPFISQTTPILSMGFGIPNGPIPGDGRVWATSAMTMGQALEIPRHRFKKNTSNVVPLNGVNLLQISTNFTFDGPRQAANLASMGGPGTQTWCPSNPACVATGAVPGPAGNNGRIIYKEQSVRQFGGAMQMGLKGFGDNSIPLGGTPPRVAHLLFGTTALLTSRTLAPGKQSMAPPLEAPTTEMVYLLPAFATQPGLISGGLIVSPGPKVTVGMGLTNTGTGATYTLFTGQFTTNNGFSHTTGTVWAQQVTGTGGHDFFTVMGSDNRSTLGGGNISLVAGGLSRRNLAGGLIATYAAFHKVFMTLGPPVPSMSPAGFAVAGVLMLLGVGYALRRRL